MKTLLCHHTGIPMEGVPGQEVRTQFSSLVIPKLSPPSPRAGVSTHTYVRMCVHTPWLSPMLQELQQEVIASVRHDVLRNPGGEKNVHWRGWRLGRKALDTWFSGGQREEGQLPGCLWDPGGQKFPGTHVVVMISSLVLRISSTGPWYLQRTAQWGGRAQRGR